MLYTQLRSFHAVARSGSYTSAAKVLNVGQPTLTTQIKALQKRFGVKLFVRHGRGVAITRAGQDLMQITYRLFLLETEAEDLLLSYKGFAKGTLRIAAVGPFHAADIIAKFKEKFPTIEIEVSLGNSFETIQRVLKYEADVAISANLSANSRLEMQPFRTHSIVALVSRSHSFFERDRVPFQEFLDQPLILREMGSTTRSALEAAANEHGLKISPAMEIGSREGVWKCIERGLGIGVVADFEFVPHPKLKLIEFEDVEIKTEYFISHLKDRDTSRLIKEFCAAASDL